MPRIVVRTLASRRANGHSISRLEQLRFGNCIVDLCLKHIEEAFFADLLTSFGAFKNCSGLLAQGTVFGRHCPFFFEENLLSFYSPEIEVLFYG